MKKRIIGSSIALLPILYSGLSHGELKTVKQSRLVTNAEQMDTITAVKNYMDIRQKEKYSERSTDTNKFNDILPTDWAYQALSRLSETY